MVVRVGFWGYYGRSRAGYGDRVQVKRRRGAGFGQKSTDRSSKRARGAASFKPLTYFFKNFENFALPFNKFKYASFFNKLVLFSITLTSYEKYGIIEVT